MNSHQKLESSVCLRIAGRNLDFGSISNETGLAATEIHLATDLTQTKKPYGRDLWIACAPLRATQSVAAKLKWLNDVLTSRRESFRQLSNNRNISTIDVFISVTCQTDECQVRIPGDLLAGTGSLELGIDISFVVYGEPSRVEISTLDHLQICVGVGDGEGHTLRANTSGNGNIYAALSDLLHRADSELGDVSVAEVKIQTPVQWGSFPLDSGVQRLLTERSLNLSLDLELR